MKNDTDAVTTEDFLRGGEETTMGIMNGAADESGFDYELGVSEEEQEFRFREAIRLAKEKSRIMGKPTCEYDWEKGKPYLLYPDGHREYPT